MWCKSLGLEKIFLVWLVLKLRMPTIFKQQKFTVIFYVLDVLLLLSVLDYSKGLLNFFSFWSKSRNTTCCYALLFTPACLYQLVFFLLLFFPRWFLQWKGLIFHFSHINLNKGRFRKEEQPQICLKFDRVTYLVLSVWGEFDIFIDMKIIQSLVLNWR